MSIFKKDENYIYLNAPYCEFYIPKYYFDETTRYAEDFTDRIRVLGILNVGIFEKGKMIKMETLNLPTFINIQVYDTEDRDIKLPNDEVVPCKVCKYFKDNIIMNSTIIEDSDNAQSFLNMIISGNLPTTIPYDKSLEIWRKNLELNNVNFGVSSTILELILANVYRDKYKPERKFAKLIGADTSVSQFDYTLASIRQICQYSSTFTALTYEDIDTMITASINRGRENKEEAETPIEKIIKM